MTPLPEQTGPAGAIISRMTPSLPPTREQLAEALYRAAMGVLRPEQPYARWFALREDYKTVYLDAADAIAAAEEAR